MYAAAGGASLASRQARQKQRKQNKNERLQQIRSHKATDIGSKPPQKGQFHNYTEQSRLSRVERNALKPPTLQPERRHSTSHLKEPSKARIRESPSVLIPVQNHLNQTQQAQPLTPSTLVQEHAPLHPSPSIQSQLPQITIPEGERTLERRCSFVRQVEEMEKGQEDLLDRCNHISNFEVKDITTSWENDLTYYSEFHRGAFGSTEYPFSEIHDTTYGGESEDDFFNIYHQSAAANALLYVGLGTTAIGFVVFFVGSGDKGFKTLELRLIGPTLIACGLLCCLIRVLLCACPSTCFQRKKKTKLRNVCPHRNRYPIERREKLNTDFVPVDPTQSLISKHKKRVSIAPPKSLPSTSTSEQTHNAPALQQQCSVGNETTSRDIQQKNNPIIPVISVPDFAELNNDRRRMSREDTCIELENLEFNYDLQSISSNDSNNPDEGDNKLVACSLQRQQVRTFTEEISADDQETCLTVVIERNDKGESGTNDHRESASERKNDSEKQSHSGIVLSPLQLGQ